MTDVSDSDLMNPIEDRMPVGSRVQPVMSSYEAKGDWSFAYSS